MPNIGLIDLDGVPRTWEAIRAGEGRWDDPTAVLMALYWPKRRYCEVSVTMLTDDVCHASLRERHDYYQRPDDLDTAMLGTGLHELMERGAERAGNVLSEERLTMTILGLHVGGIPDLVLPDGEGYHILDYKTTSVYQARYLAEGGVETVKPEWVMQLNFYAHLLRQAGFPVSRLTVRVFVRDYRRFEAVAEAEKTRRHAAGDTYKFGPRKGTLVDAGKPYPRGMRIEIPLWSQEKCNSEMAARVATWKAHRDDSSTTLPICDTWERGDGYRMRCEEFCAVNTYCPHWASWQREVKP